MKKFFLIFIIIFSLIGFVGCTQKDDTKSQFIKDFDISPGQCISVLPCQTNRCAVRCGD